MRRLMIAASAMAVLATAAWGDAHKDGAFRTFKADEATQIFASDLLGARIHASESELDRTVETGAEREWDDLGEINDIVMNDDGSVEVVILGIGGFLGIGERNVAVRFGGLTVARNVEDPTAFLLVVNASREEIEAAPEFLRANEETAMGASESAAEDADAESEAAAEDTASETDAVDEDAADVADDAADEADDAAAETESGSEGDASDTESR